MARYVGGLIGRTAAVCISCNLGDLAAQVLDASTFDAIFDSCSIVRRALCGQLVLKDFQSLKERVGRLHAEVQVGVANVTRDVFAHRMFLTACCCRR